MTKTHKSPDEETVDKDMQQAKRTPPYMVIPPLLFDLLFYFFHQNVLTPFNTLSNIWTGFVLASNHNFSAAYVR